MNWHLNGMSVWVLVVGAAIAAGLTLVLTPRGRRAVALVPIATLLVLVLIVISVGRNHLGNESVESQQKADAKAAVTYKKSCDVALALSNNELYSSTRDHLSNAVSTRPELTKSAPAKDKKNVEAGDNACTEAVSVLRAANADAGIQVDVNTSAASSNTAEEDVDLVDAARRGTEDITQDILETVIGGTKNGRDQELNLGPWGWLVLAILVVIATVIWARFVAWYVRRHATPFVKLNGVVEGDDDTKNGKALTAAIKAHMYDKDLQPVATPSGSLPEDIAGIIENSGVSGGKLVSAIVTLLRRLFGVEAVLGVTVTASSAGSPAVLKYATVEIVDHQSGRQRIVKTLEQGANEDLPVQIAAFVKSEALHDRSQQAPWERWPFEALLAYLLGIDEEGKVPS